MGGFKNLTFFVQYLIIYLFISKRSPAARESRSSPSNQTYENENSPSTKHRNTNGNRKDEHYGSNNTLVSTDTSVSSHGNTSGKSSIPGAETSSTPESRSNHRNAGSHSNIATKNNESFVSSGGMDSGFGLEEEENTTDSNSRPASRVSLQAGNNERTSSFSGDIDRSIDTSGSFRESSASALEDSAEMSYYKEMERFNRGEQLVRDFS